MLIPSLRHPDWESAADLHFMPGTEIPFPSFPVFCCFLSCLSFGARIAIVSLVVKGLAITHSLLPDHRVSDS